MARILVVDDYPAIPVMLEAMLGAAGHEVFTADCAEAGLELANQIRPDLVLLDVDMPDRDGLAVCADLGREPATAHIPVLLMTGRLCLAVLEQGRQAGARGFLSKPFSRECLLEEIARALGGFAQGASPALS
jgi:twitching motility two-component system response regulator PilH